MGVDIGVAHIPVRRAVRIALAVPYEGHQPDEVIEVDAAEGTRLVHLGSARRVLDAAEALAADPAPDVTWKAAAIRAWLKRHDYPIPGSARSAADLFAVYGEATAPTTNPPAEAANPEETA